MTIAILPGFGEGPWHIKRLAWPLEKAGFTVQHDAETADIVVTHSAGCFFLPNTPKNKLIILIGPPYRPDRPSMLIYVQKLLFDLAACIKAGRLLFWIIKTIWNIIYLLGDIKRAFYIATVARRYKFFEALEHKNTVIIHNHHDVWITRKIIDNLPHGKRFKVYELPGQHDDCWRTTKLHANLIIKIIKERYTV